MASSPLNSYSARRNHSKTLSDIDTTLRRQSSDSSTSSTTSQYTTSPTTSSISLNTSYSTLPSPGPRVQLIPHSRTLSYDAALSDTDRAFLDQTSLNFDSQDVSSRDFDFEDIFTYDKPQKKLSRCIEVSSHGRSSEHNREKNITGRTRTGNNSHEDLLRIAQPMERNWGNFSFSHYGSAVAIRNKVNHPHRSSTATKIAELYVKNQVDARRR